MKAAVLHELGGIPRYEDFPDPVAGEGEDASRTVRLPPVQGRSFPSRAAADLLVRHALTYLRQTRYQRSYQAVPECLRRSCPVVRGAGNRGAARAFKMVPVAAGSVWRVTGIEPGRAGMLTEFAGLSTPLVADACIRRKVPLRVAPPGIGAVIPGRQIAGRALPARHYGSVDVFLEAFSSAGHGDVLVLTTAGGQMRPA